MFLLLVCLLFVVYISVCLYSAYVDFFAIKSFKLRKKEIHVLSLCCASIIWLHFPFIKLFIIFFLIVYCILSPNNSTSKFTCMYTTTKTIIFSKIDIIQ